MLASRAPGIVLPPVTSLAAEPAVVDGAIRFAFPHEPGLRRVSLRHELRRPRVLQFERRGRRWELRLDPPPADRFEYLLELERVTGTEVIPDPANPLRARGPFGDKSVVELPTYEPPTWVGDEVSQEGTLRGLRLESRRLRSAVDGLLWSAAGTDPAEPLPLLIVHDGPEYADYADLLRLFDHLMDFGDVPEFRAALLAPPGDRNESYSASARYGNALAAELLPALAEEAPVSHEPVLLGASLGAVAALHAHWLNPGVFSGLFLQSGSFFRRRFDGHEAGFPRFARITRFVGRVHGGRGYVARVPTVITCGAAEENLENNRALAGALARQEWELRFVENRDAHTWTGWRDALQPHLADLLLAAWT
jgi:enterochelin esterase family protein